MTNETPKGKKVEIEFEVDAADIEGTENNISLADLLKPEPITITWTDGEVLTFREQGDLSPSDSAKVTKLANLIGKNMDALVKDPNNKAAEKRAERYMTNFLQIMLPDLDEEALKELSFGEKGLVMDAHTQKINQRQNAKNFQSEPSF